MAHFKSEGSFTPDRLVIGEYQARKVTIASGAGALARGTVLGRVTASGKFTKSAAAANDGSQVPSMILAHTIDATSADVETVAYIEGRFDQDALTLGAGHTLGSIDFGFRQLGIFLEKTLG